MSSHRRSVVHPAMLVVIVAAALLLSGCRSQPLLTPPLIPSSMEAEQNRQAILRGMAAHHWLLVGEVPGRLTAKLDRAGKHIAIVDIRYDDRSIAIAYKSSTGLRCEPEGAGCSSIHRAYNRWVAQLAKDIEYGVQMVRIESPNGPSVAAPPPAE